MSAAHAPAQKPHDAHDAEVQLGLYRLFFLWGRVVSFVILRVALAHSVRPFLRILPRLVLSSSALWGTPNEAWPSIEWADMGQLVVPVPLQVPRMLFRSVTAVLSFLPCSLPTSVASWRGLYLATRVSVCVFRYGACTSEAAQNGNIVEARAFQKPQYGDLGV